MFRPLGVVTVLLVSCSVALGQKDAGSLTLLQQLSTKLTQDQTITSVVASGQLVDLRTEAKRAFQFRALGADQIRWDSVNDEGQAVTTVIIGNGGWVEKDGQRVKVLSVAETVGRKLEFVLAAQLADWIASSDVVLEAAVDETLDRKLLKRVGIRRRRTGDTDRVEEITTRAVLIDAQQALPVRLRYLERSRDWRETSPIELEYSNFQEAAGFFVPLTVTTFRNGTAIQQIVFDSIVFNAPVSEADFGRSQ